MFDHKCGDLGNSFNVPNYLLGGKNTNHMISNEPIKPFPINNINNINYTLSSQTMSQILVNKGLKLESSNKYSC